MNMARAREYKQYRNEKQRQQKGDKTRTHYEATKKKSTDRFLSGKVLYSPRNDPDPEMILISLHVDLEMIPN